MWNGCFGAGPEPDVEVDLFRGRRDRLLADAPAGLVAQGARDQQLAELAGPDGLDGLGPLAVGAALRPVLDDPVVLPGGLDGDAPLVHVVAARLLDVDVLAGLAGPDRHQRVPVVGRGDRDGVNRLVLEHAADVLLGGRRMTAGLAGLARDRLDLLEPFGIGPRVGIDQADDLDAGHGGEFAHVGTAAPVEPRHGDADGVIGADDPAGRLGPADREGRPHPGGGHRTAQKGSAIQACSRHRSGSCTVRTQITSVCANPQTKVEQLRHYARSFPPITASAGEDPRVSSHPGVAVPALRRPGTATPVVDDGHLSLWIVTPGQSSVRNGVAGSPSAL